MYLSKAAVSLSLGLLAVMASTTTLALDKAAAGAAFHPSSQDWATAYNAGEADRIVAMYARDAVVMPPDAPAATTATLRDYLVKDIANAKKAGITLAIVDGKSASSGNLGWHEGTFTLVDTTGKTVGTGKYVEVWERKDGKWTMIRDIWNNDAPAAAATAPTAPKD
ncbi:YybH family protein [Cognatiluteimonas profundi]|uniref:YybH family protein n=1 Tax=Cognatiluteimonas profundi TaxID=2594501 RepID=UPI00131B30FB|nr:nuclear transport factor 2 family protein [Lysobacter profundi]